MRKFMIGAWPTIEQFPQFMAMNLKKLSVGQGEGEDLARRYLIHNIRVEQKHADHWIDWARIGRSHPRRPEGRHRHRGAVRARPLVLVRVRPRQLCRSRSRPPTTRSKASPESGRAWSCSKPTYAASLPEEVRAPATRWLRLHAEYDDTHPWEALEIVATLLGETPAQADVEAVRRAIRSTYVYFRMGLDHALAEMLHGSFDETASNASTLGALDAA